MFSRRGAFLVTTTIGAMAGLARAWSAVVKQALPWSPFAADPPTPVTPGPWKYLTADEAAAVEAIVDRLIPADPETPGGKDIGCAVYIDRQLAGTFGSGRNLYMQPPFATAAPGQGYQLPLSPAEMYRKGLAALDQYCRATFGGKPFAQLSDDQKDQVLGGLEKGEIALSDIDAKAFFTQVLSNTQEGFFADPLYGGNRDMAAWKMIGFPGARYDYRDWIDRHNERYPLPPVSIYGRAEWSPSTKPSSS